MNTFSDLLDTKRQLTVCVGNETYYADLTDTLVFPKDQIVSVDGIEVLPKLSVYTNLVGCVPPVVPT